MVFFGSEVAFKHIDSGYYLAGQKDSSSTHNTGYKCILTEEFGKSSIFELMSFYKSKKLGDVINPSNSMIIKNTNNNCFLTVDSNDTLRTYYPDHSVREDPLRPDILDFDPHCRLHSSMFVSEGDTGWSFQVFLSQAERVRQERAGRPLRGLDLVYLLHPEMKAEVCSDLIYNGTSPEVYFRKYESNNPIEERSMNSVWQIEHLDLESQGDLFESIQNNEEVLSNKLTTRIFRLRHFLTGRLMIVTCLENVHGHQSQVTLQREIPTRSATEKDKDSNYDKSLNPNKKLEFSEEEGGSIGGLEASQGDVSEENNAKDKFNFEFVIMEEKFLRNKCLVYLQSEGCYLSRGYKGVKFHRQVASHSLEAKKSIAPISSSDLEETKHVN